MFTIQIKFCKLTITLQCYIYVIILNDVTPAYYLETRQDKNVVKIHLQCQRDANIKSPELGGHLPRDFINDVGPLK